MIRRAWRAFDANVDWVGFLACMTAAVGAVALCGWLVSVVA